MGTTVTTELPGTNQSDSDVKTTRSVRINAWNEGGTFKNEALLWYAKGVQVMQSRQLNDPASWWFFAAIHNEYVVTPPPPGDEDHLWKVLPSPPSVPTSPLPSQDLQKTYWNQCQHQSWYFAPWHRGYLIALEAQLRADLVKLGGPETWALPYWNYLGPGEEYKMPPAFAEKKLPDGNPNALYVDARFGPDGDGKIYIPTKESMKIHKGDPNFTRGPVTDDCYGNTIYTGSNPRTPPPGFGGPVTNFQNDGNISGNIENNPHNLVHVYVGGTSAINDKLDGLMADPGTAGLDPIFYLHHANIDRMWMAWNLALSNANPTDPNWLNGPAASGDRTFIMPMPNDSNWTYIPADVSDWRKLGYTYDKISAPIKPITPYEAVAARLMQLGATDAAAKVAQGVAVTIGTKNELVGATQKALSLGRAGASAAVPLDANVRGKISRSFALAADAAADKPVAPDQVYLNLENVRGAFNASVLSVYINLPEDATPDDFPELLAGGVALFGLSKASQKDDQHGGHGMSFVLDITPIVDRLHLEHSLDANSLQVRIVPDKPLPEHAQITIGRISIYREGQ